MRRFVFSLSILVGLAVPATLVRPQAIAPSVEDIPRDFSLSARAKDAFEFKHAWIDKARKTRENRERYIKERGFYNRDLLPASQQPLFSVTGNLVVPVFCVKFSDTGADPLPISQLETKLFDGPYTPLTARQYYREISYGDLDISGTVYGWTTLPNPEIYYAGPGDCHGECGAAHLGDLIVSTLTVNDGAVDFAQYDNDGPDGIPNSGDDDGYVDFVSFVHPTRAAECLGMDEHIWSHRSTIAFQTGVPYTTDDARAGGGFIQVDDYTIQPIYNCDSKTLVDIGVFCHEWGHALGLRDLYDTDGGSSGVGAWCLMGSGGSNSRSEPAHMGAWAKSRLGWTNQIVVPATPTPFTIYDVETHRDVYRLDVMHEYWRRLDSCTLAGNYSMHCGLTTTQAAARNWASGEGYGNRWDATVSRDFNYDGSAPVTLQYQYAHALEPSFDFAYGTITVGSTTSVFARYSNVGSGTANIDLTPYLSAPTAYTISFRVTSDGGYSDEDGHYATECGAMSVDNISVTGGGESYSTNFEKREDGWAQVMDPPSEYFLVENRKPLGSDVKLPGGGGLIIWHIDGADQTGGPSNNRPRGVEVVQADGMHDLEDGHNNGDARDPYPGGTNNTAFDGASTPNSNGHDGASTVAVTHISANGNPMTAMMKGGWPAPVPGSIAPSVSPGMRFSVQIAGARFVKTPSVQLVRGAQTFDAERVEWIGRDRVVAEFDMEGGINGHYDMVMFNPGGASSALSDALYLTGGVDGPRIPPKQNALLAAYPNPFNPETTIRYELASSSHVSLRVYDVGGAEVRTLVDANKAAGSYALQWNGRDNKGNAVSSGVYFYRISAGSFSDVRKMTLLK